MTVVKSDWQRTRNVNSLINTEKREKAWVCTTKSLFDEVARESSLNKAQKSVSDRQSFLTLHCHSCKELFREV